MIILPIGEETTPVAPARLQPDAEIANVKLLALGFSSAERELIQGVVALSQRRSFRVELVDAQTWTRADVILLDGADAKVVTWAAAQPLLSKKTVVWVDSAVIHAGQTLLKRPIQWPALPALLQRALGLEITASARVPLSDH